ncbi:hypothetical protein MtrunA17_Chr2g0293461 [Medicago truncatula]|nr:hypothetical protein MtrunA17_Chr2g0293461 [Medicago truncatula]
MVEKEETKHSVSVADSYLDLAGLRLGFGLESGLIVGAVECEFVALGLFLLLLNLNLLNLNLSSICVYNICFHHTFLIP